MRQSNLEWQRVASDLQKSNQALRQYCRQLQLSHSEALNSPLDITTTHAAPPATIAMEWDSSQLLWLLQVSWPNTLKKKTSRVYTNKACI